MVAELLLVLALTCWLSVASWKQLNRTRAKLDEHSLPFTFHNVFFFEAVIKDAQRKEAERLLAGPHDLDRLLAEAARGEPRKEKDND